MALPVVTIPDFPLPFNIPLDIHPCVVHLAVALPIVIVLIELVNLVAKKRALGVFSFVLMVLLAVILFGAYLTGSADAEHAKAALTGDAKTLFDAHKLQGVYLVYGAALLVLVKLISVLVRNTFMRIIFLIFLLAFTALTLNTAKKGKELVFNYGINVKTTASAPAVSQAPATEMTASAAKTEEPKSEAPKAEAAKATEEKAPEAAAEAATAPKAETAPVAEAEVKAPTKEEAAKAEESMKEEAPKTSTESAAPAPEKKEEAAAPSMTEAPSAPEAPETPAQ